jgi:DNA-binding PadR family transcriptional regulator
MAFSLEVAIEGAIYGLLRRLDAHGLMDHSRVGRR